MPAYKKTLVEDNGDIIYPQTTADAVNFGDSDLKSVVNNKAEKTELTNYIQKGNVVSSDITTGAVTETKIADKAITNAKIANGAVKSDNVDWTTLPTGITSNLDWSSFFKTGSATVSYQGPGTSGGYVEITFDKPFKSTPIVLAQDALVNGRIGGLSVSNVTTNGFRLLARQDYSQTTSLTVNWIAISPKG